MMIIFQRFILKDFFSDIITSRLSALVLCCVFIIISLLFLPILYVYSSQSQCSIISAEIEKLAETHNHTVYGYHVKEWAAAEVG